MNPIIAAGLGGIINTVGQVADDLFTSDEERSRAELETYKAESERMLGQVEINKIEAASGNAFNSGWRPAIGWVCAITLALAYIPKALVITVMWSIQAYAVVTTGGALPPFPELGLTDILGLLFSILGLGTLRTAEKIKGKA